MSASGFGPGDPNVGGSKSARTPAVLLLLSKTLAILSVRAR